MGDDTQQDDVLRDVSVRIAKGDAEAGDELMLLAYDELRQLAGVYLRKHRPGGRPCNPRHSSTRHISASRRPMAPTGRADAASSAPRPTP